VARFISTFRLERTGIRIWVPGETLPGRSASSIDEFAVEWAAAQKGHPTTYALLGGRSSTCSETTFNLDPSSGRFVDAMTGIADTVEFGSSDGRNPTAISLAAERVGQPLEVTLVGEGYASSSPVAFSWVTEILARVVQSQGTITDEDVLNAWNARFRPSGYPGDDEASRAWYKAMNKTPTETDASA
jgi:hypothetical protein